MLSVKRNFTHIYRIIVEHTYMEKKERKKSILTDNYTNQAGFYTMLHNSPVNLLYIRYYDFFFASPEIIMTSFERTTGLITFPNCERKRGFPVL